MIRRLTLAEIAHALDLEPPAGSESLQVTAVSIDSRTVQPGEIFVALRGRPVSVATWMRMGTAMPSVRTDDVAVALSSSAEGEAP